jgi:ApaG protein
MRACSATTEGITVSAQPMYLDGESDSVAHKFVFAYFIRIKNDSGETVQLLRRHWFIHDAKGAMKEVEGEGVVGKRPVIHSGEVHEYNSYCILETFEGYMEGTYLLQRENGDTFKVVIPRFNLRAAAN